MATKRLQTGKTEPMHFNARIAGIDYDILDELTGYAVRRAQLSIYEDFARALAAEALTPQRFSSLVIIENNPGISQTRLAEVMGIARSGVVAIIDRFEKDAIVERCAADDRRSYDLRLTRQGQKEVKRYKKAVKAHDEHVSQALSAAEKTQLRTLLNKLCQHEAGNT
jgi:DNA-binding MarR family transcriptional regulator